MQIYWEFSEREQLIQHWDKLIQNWDKLIQNWDKLIQNWDKLKSFPIPPSPLFTGLPVWGTLSEVPHTFPTTSPLNYCKVQWACTIDRGVKVWVIHFAEEGGTYGEPGGNLRRGSPSRNPFVHRRSGRLGGKGEPSPIFVLLSQDSIVQRFVESESS